MSTIKQDRKDLEMLLNGISPIEGTSTPATPNQSTLVQGPAPQQQQSVIDNAGSEIGVEKVFEFNYESIRKGLRKKARKTVLNIANHILTETMVEEDYVQDKIEQDIETLTDLYMQVETNTLMQQALVSTVSKGNLMPRYFEVFGQLTEKISALNKQVVSTEQTIRKTYLDLKFEIRDKQEEEMGANGNLALGTTQPTNTGTLVTSSLDLIAKAKAKHREAIEAAKETTYVEE